MSKTLKDGRQVKVTMMPPEKAGDASMLIITAGPPGTPSSLVAALQHVSEHLGLNWGAKERYIARMHLRDFMSQRFSEAMFRNPESEAALKKLFDQLFG